jgi:Holliday junction resolvase RusA-like endonuclease
MGTVGKFTKIYERVREYFLNGVVTGIPSDSVVRYNGDQWIIESRTKPQNQEIVLEVSLREFWIYFDCNFEDMRSNGYTISKQDIDDYIKFVKDIREMYGITELYR